MLTSNLVTCLAVLSPLVASADEPSKTPVEATSTAPAPTTTPTTVASTTGSPSPAPPALDATSVAVETSPRGHRPGLEINVLWPFFPGGIFEARYVAPLLRSENTFHGSIVAGVYSDFASRVVRTEQHGKVGNLSAKLGWRQYFVRGLHLEVSANAGWRREVMRPSATVDPIDGFQIRLWLLPGIEYDFSPRFYANARGAVGLHILRTGPLGDQEKQVVGGGDLNFGVRF